MAEPVASESVVEQAAAAAAPVAESLQTVKEWLVLHGTEYGIKLIGSSAILVIGRWVARALSIGIQRLMERRKVDPMICGFLGNLAYALILTFLVIAAIQNLQVPTASFVAVVGAAGLAIGLAPQVLVSELADSSVNFILRTWVKGSDYWGVKFDTTEKVKMTFDAEGVSIPFPQRDVHLFQK